MLSKIQNWFANDKIRSSAEVALVGSFVVKVVYIDWLKSWAEGLLTSTTGRVLYAFVAIAEILHFAVVVAAVADLISTGYKKVLETSYTAREKVGLA